MHTEESLTRLLRQRYDAQHGNGQRYVHAAAVRSHAGFDARRTADFIAMDLWPSKRLALHGHEIKVSRSDWLRELKEPEKAEEFRRYMNFWWLVAPVGIAKPEEIPDGWGLMVVAGDQLRVQISRGNPSPEPMPRTMMAAFLRAVDQQARVFGRCDHQITRHIAYYRRTEHCAHCGEPGDFCMCRPPDPCGCRDLHPMGSGLAPDAVQAFAESTSADQVALFGGDS